MQRSGPGAGRGLLVLLLRASVAIYWVTVAALGCARLMHNGLSALMPVVHAWYLAALAFLVVWAPVVVVGSLVTARGEAKLAPLKRESAPLRLR